MDTGASLVRVCWDPIAYPPRRPDRRRVVATGPGLPPAAAVLHRVPPESPPAYGLELADEHLVADADAGGPWPRVADVLIVRGTLLRRAAVRAEFPGRLVTAFTGPGQEHVLEVGTGWLARLVPLRPGTVEAVWPYASFVHAWTAAGRPLDALHDARLTKGPPGMRRGVRVIVVEHSTGRRDAA